MGKKKHEEEHENHERWLVSYADFITLLFAFFVVMYSTSRQDQKKLVQVAEAIKFAMHFKGTGGIRELPIFKGPPTDNNLPTNQHSPFRNETPKLPRNEPKELSELRKRLQQKLKRFLQERPDPKPIVTMDVEGKRLAVRLSAAHFFDPSQAAIRPEMIPVLDAIAAELTSLGRNIRIEGHTDDGRFTSSRFRDNWDLSAARAASVASYVQRAFRYDGRLLAATGYASTRPLAPNDTPEGREANRRVEMVVEVNPDEPFHRFAR